jgi:hypothetical protein
MRLQAPIRLSLVDAKAFLMAIQEFNDLGRDRFLKKYGFSRSSKFYLIHEQRLYDTKALLGAAYLHATGRKLTKDKFAGGAQTEAVFRRINKQYQFNCSLFGRSGHSGGATLRKKGFSQRKLWLSIRSFPLGYGLEDGFARSFRSSQIRWLERSLLHEYVCANQTYPQGNSK